MILKIDGKDYKAFLGTNNLVEVKKVTGKSMEQMVKEGFEIESTRALFWAALLHKVNGDLTLEQAGELADAAGGPTWMIETVGRLMEEVFPKPADGEETEGNAKKATA